ncbi:hypothetical protein D3C81_851290 [compost metagenome]
MAPSMAPTVLQAHTAPPSTVSRPRLVDPRHAWMDLHRNQIFRQLNEENPRMAWIYVSTKVDTHQQQQKSVEGGVGPVAGVSAAWMPRPSLQGRTCGVPRNRTHPAIPQEPGFCRCRCRCCCCCLGLGGCRAQPCRNPNLNSLFCVRSHPSARLCGSAAAVRFPPGSPATGVRPIARPHSDAVRHAFQPALRVGCTQFSQRGSRERSESADQFDLPPSVRSDRR